jgi:hypothetical protein
MPTAIQIVWFVAAPVAGLLMALARTGPHEAISNLSKWAEWAGIHKIPGWLRSPAVDRWVFGIGASVIVILLFLGGLSVNLWFNALSQRRPVFGTEGSNARIELGKGATIHGPATFREADGGIIFQLPSGGHIEIGD